MLSSGTHRLEGFAEDLAGNLGVSGELEIEVGVDEDGGTGGGSAGDDDAVDGCACGVDARPSYSMLSWLMLLGLGAGASRRRRAV